jgi:hypothetical protein
LRTGLHSEPSALPKKGSKKRKASEAEGDENKSVPAKKAAKGISHPENVSHATQQFAEAIYKELQAHGKPMSMGILSQKVKKPPMAEKVGKVVSKYDCFVRSEEGKCKDMVSLKQ